MLMASDLSAVVVLLDQSFRCSMLSVHLLPEIRILAAAPLFAAPLLVHSHYSCQSFKSLAAILIRAEAQPAQQAWP